jgi:photosystem II stability/assembly factor-like uncharacterized protein
MLKGHICFDFNRNYFNFIVYPNFFVTFFRYWCYYNSENYKLAGVMKILLKILLVLSLFPTLAFSGWLTTEGSSGEIKSLSGNSGKLYAGSYGNGAFFSQTKGATWIPINTGIETNLVWDVKPSGNLIFSATDGKGVYMSTNSGLNWSTVNNGLGHFSVFGLAVDQNNLYAMTDESGLFYTTDNGTSWGAMNNGDLTLRLFSIAAKNGVVYVGSEFGNLYKTTDFGQTWDNLKSGSLTFNIKSIYFADNNIYLGTSNGVFVSADEGVTWIQHRRGMLNNDVTSVVKTGNKLFAATNGGGVYFSDNGGEVWIDINEDIPDNKIISLTFDDEYLYAGTSSQGIIRRKLSEIVFPQLIAPVLLSPDNNSENNDYELTLKWSTSNGAASYHVKVALNSDFTNMFNEKDQVNNNFYTLPGLAKSTVYYWKVSANSFDNQKQWSEVWTFKTKTDLTTSTLIFPEADMKDVPLPVTFKWNKADGAVNYILHVTTDSTFEELTANSGPLTDTIYKTISLSEKTDYFWKVISVGPDQTTLSSEIRKFKSGIQASVVNIFSDDDKYLEIFPNPSNGEFNLKVNIPTITDSRIEVFNYLGNKIWETQFDNNQSESINLRHLNLSSGVYSVSFISSEKRFIKKLVIF